MAPGIEAVIFEWGGMLTAQRDPSDQFGHTDGVPHAVIETLPGLLAIVDGWSWNRWS